ncbi:MAG TPA: 3-hydroxyacyl-CoA dehydrogenase NAD-binding domain-containing protein [Thermoplasmataceae archaeon]|nr:3-hydroxybutyryl-CoA dehydrogenase [Thermoplasmatales archaeon AK]HLH86313.1 3-hydroxyacyl-CoA dehydrogenase NAD-binding domain-containing protein [Thermoplasmataceae archaeon]
MKVSVLGCGTMGKGIAQVFATYGNSVVAYDSLSKALEKAPSDIGASLDRLAKKDPEKFDKQQILPRITFTGNLEEIRGSDLVIEAVFERVEEKTALLRKVSDIIDDRCMLATNTSSISINKLASAVRNPGRFLGMHFFNPVPVMKLVELVKGEHTDEAILKKAYSISESIEKSPVISKDFPGFISNRILMPLIREAIAVYEEGIATPQDIDKTLRLGMNHPMGPLELADFVGLDVVYDVLKVLYDEYGEPRFKPPITLRNMVNSGKLGRKSGEGFYKY